jgi:hypothetical protein
MRKPELALAPRLSEFMRKGLCALGNDQQFQLLKCVLGKCLSCSMSNCASVDHAEEGADAESFELEYYGYTTQTDATGRERKFLDLKVRCLGSCDG